MKFISKRTKAIIKFVKNNRLEMAVLFLILLVGSFLRFYRLPEYMTFLGDEGRDALAVKRMIVDHKFRLIGPVTSIGNMYLGPLYYYLMLPAMVFSRLSPVGPAALVAFLGVVTIGLIWLAGREWFDSRTGLIAAGLYALSPVAIIYSRSSWNPNVMPFFALLTIYGVSQFWLKQKFGWLPILGITLSFCVQSHYLGLLLLPTVALFWLLTLVANRHQQTKLKVFLFNSLLLIIFFCFLTVVPLVWFDFRHHFINFKAFKEFFTVRQTTVNLKFYKAIPKLGGLTAQVFTRLLAGKNEAYGGWLALLTFVGLFGLSFRRSDRRFVWRKIWRENRELILVLVWLMIGLIGLGNYKQHIYDHYFGFFFPAPFLLVAWVLSRLWELPLKRFLFKSLNFSQLLVVVSLVGLVVLAVSESPLRYPPNNQLGRTKEVARFIIEQAQKKPFNLALIAERNYQDAYAYFMELWGTPATKIDPLRAEETITDQLFVICEKLPCQPINHPLAEIANFGWAKIDQKWKINGVEIYRLIHTQ